MENLPKYVRIGSMHSLTLILG